MHRPNNDPRIRTGMLPPYQTVDAGKRMHVREQLIDKRRA
jgi:hypothetical protein